MIDTDIATYLSTSTSTWTLGTNIFAGNMPYTPDTCCSVTQTQGLPPSKTTDMEFPGFQVKVRAAAYATAFTRINDILDALHRLTNTTVGSNLCYWIEAQGSPSYLGRDQANRALFTCNFIANRIIE